MIVLLIGYLVEFSVYKITILIIMFKWQFFYPLTSVKTKAKLNSCYIAESSKSTKTLQYWTWVNNSNFCQPCFLQDSSETVGVVLDMLKTILPSLTDNYLKVSPMGSTQRAQKALYTLHNTPKLTQPTDELMVCTCSLTSWVYCTIRHYDLCLDWTLNTYQKKNKCTVQCTCIPTFKK